MRQQWALLVLGFTIFQHAVSAEPLVPDASFTETWLAVSVNAQPADDVVLFMRDTSGRVLAAGASLRHWRVRLPPQPTLTRQGESYFALDAMPGLSYRVDEEQQLLQLEVRASLFDSVSIAAKSADYAPAPKPPLGAFLNYDVVATNAAGRSTLGGLLEGSLFGAGGAGVVRYLERQEDGQTHSVRLDSTWTRDRPEAASSFRVGDSITGASRWWGGAVHFGGLQLASNYATRPGLITSPMPSIAGEAAVPSTFELYVNNALRLRESLPAGPFSVDDVPVVTGDGQIRLIVRDVLGREQVISEPYYASPRLLRAGLHDYSIEAGVTREDFGLESNHYGRPLLVATDRVGLTDRFTAELHGELLRDQQTAGAAGALLFSSFGVVSTSVAFSHAEPGNGALVGFGFERTAQRLSFGASAEFATADFTHLGLLPGDTAPRRQSQLYATAAFGRIGSVGISRTRQDFWDGRKIEILSLRDSINFRSLGYLSLSALRVLGEERDTIIALSFTHSIDQRTSASVTGTSSAGGSGVQLDVQRSLPAGRGMGYRVSAASDQHAADSTLSLQNDVGTYELEAQQRAGAILTRASASGGVVMLGGHLFPSRRIDSSFAVAQVGRESGVRVYRENQLIGRTDASGYLLLPGLRAYQDNVIRIEQADLPLDVPVDSMQVQAVPWFRSGVLLAFPVERPHGALLAVRLDNGEPLPAGALVYASAESEKFPSGLHGEVYVTGLAPENHLHAEWIGGRCEFTVSYAQSSDPLPRLGPFECKRVP